MLLSHYWYCLQHCLFIACGVCHTAAYIGVWERPGPFSPLYSSASVREDLFLSRLLRPVSLGCMWTSRLQLLRAENPRPGFDTWDFSNPQNHGYSSHSGDWSCGKPVSGFTTLELTHLLWMSAEQGMLVSLHLFSLFCLLHCPGSSEYFVYRLLSSLLSWVSSALYYS